MATAPTSPARSTPAWRRPAPTPRRHGFIIYTIFVDLSGTQGNSTVLQNCATDSSKYFDLTTSGAIVTDLQPIAQQITNLRVSQ